MATSAEAASSGVAVVDKPAGWTSHQVVARIRRIAGTRKVGHAGTLDPMATGVLVVGINRATRLLGHLSLSDKAYAATVRLGVATLTDDAEGEVTAAVGAGTLTEAVVRDALSAFRGEIWQVPSAVSAIKVAGVRSYARVRSGEAVELAARQVRIARLDLLAAAPGHRGGVPMLDLQVEVRCSSGTYVRALARDLGAALGCGGHLTALRRTAVGRFTLADAQTLEQAGEHLELIDLADAARGCFAALDLDEESAQHVRHGRRLDGLELPAEVTALFGGGEFLALYRRGRTGAVPEAVFVG